MTEGFRLIYLKSSDIQGSKSNSIACERSEQMPKENSSSTSIPSSEIFWSEVFLNQIKKDLKHPDSKVRILAIRSLEKLIPSIPVPLLQEMVSDPDAEVRAQAISSLTKFRSPAIIPFLKKCLKDEDPRVRMTALRGIFYQSEKMDLNILLQLLSDESPWIRRKVATLLGWSPIEGQLPLLMELSKDREPMVRKAALFSLLTLYPEESEGRWVEAMSDLDPDLRKWVRDQLEKEIERRLKRKISSLQKQG
jgi:HEAT repeat protein